MVNWKDNLSSFCRVNGCEFAMTPKQVEEWASGVIGDLIKEVKRRSDEVKIEKDKNKELVCIIDTVTSDKARLVHEFGKEIALLKNRLMETAVKAGKTSDFGI